MTRRWLTARILWKHPSTDERDGHLCEGNWLLIGTGLLVGVLAIAAVACGGGDHAGTLAATFTATLAEVEGNGVTGIATLSELDDGTTQVLVRLAGVDGTHANHLHHGTCDAQGEVFVTLTELKASVVEGHAAAVTLDFPEENPDPKFSHFETGHYVAVHEAEGMPGPVISCGNVE